MSTVATVPIVRHADVKPGTVYYSPSGWMVKWLRGQHAGREAHSGPCIVIATNDDRSDDEIRASVSKWRFAQ